MHHSTIHTEKSNKMQQCIKIYYSIFIWRSTCFGQHTAHHQEPKTALAASGLRAWKVVGCCGCWTPTTSNNLPHTQTRGCQCSFRLLMMGGVSPETCWASYKYGIINFETLLHLVRFLLYEFLHFHCSAAIFPPSAVLICNKYKPITYPFLCCRHQD